MSGALAARRLHEVLPALDQELYDYLAGYLRDSSTAQTCAEDDGAELDDMLRPAFESESDALAATATDIDGLLAELRRLLVGENDSTPRARAGPAKLDSVFQLGKAPAMSQALLPGAIDISATNKARETQVDLRKLEKAEAKLKAKAEKRQLKTGMNLFEGTKLLDAAAQKKAYEAMYMAVNPLQLGEVKGKSKDIHLENIEVSYGSLRILANASLTLAYGRRYGLVGSNGVGKSTLLKQMALREVAIPAHISILYVEQEVHGDETTAIDSVLQADVWREHTLNEERELNAALNDPTVSDARKDEASTRLGEVHQILIDIDAATGPTRAAELLFGLGFSETDMRKTTKSLSSGAVIARSHADHSQRRMENGPRVSLARALFCKPDLLMLDEPSNNLDLNALAWLEDYMAETWKGTLLVVSHDRSFLDAVATDIVHQHSQRLDYFKGNFTQFWTTRAERAKALRREYEAQMAHRAHLQAFIDRWRYNANRAAQAQSKIKELARLPELEAPEDEHAIKFRFEDTDKISPPLLQLNEVTFGYDGAKPIISNANVDVSLDSRIALIGPNGAGKSTLLKLMIGEVEAQRGNTVRNGKLRIAYFAQHQVDALQLDLNPVAFLAQKFPGRTEQEYRQVLGAFGITGMTGLQTMNTLSGGQKSRVAFAILSLQRPHVLVLDEPTNHLDVEAMDALMAAINAFNGAVLLVSHDTTFIHNTAKTLYVVADGAVTIHKGTVEAYKQLILANTKAKPF